MHNETVEHDLHRFTDLARRQARRDAGRGHPGRGHSPRLHEMLPPQGFSRELRLALHGRGTLWGALVLLREHGRPPFSHEQAVATTAIDSRSPGGQTSQRTAARAATTAAGPRRGNRPAGRHRRGHQPPGRRLVRRFAAAEQPLPYIALRAVAAARTRLGPRADQLARIRTKSGRWLGLAACPLGGGRVAVVVQPATPDQLLPHSPPGTSSPLASTRCCTFSCRAIPSSRSRGAWDCPPIPSRTTSRPSIAKPQSIVTKNSLPHFDRHAPADPCP